MKSVHLRLSHRSQLAMRKTDLFADCLADVPISEAERILTKHLLGLRKEPSRAGVVKLSDEVGAGLRTWHSISTPSTCNLSSTSNPNS